MASRQTHSGGMLGTPSECRHRDTVYQQLCGDILREARDLPSLALASTRALAHPDVRTDGLLAGMVRSFVAVRDAELRARLADQHREEEKEAGHFVPPTEWRPAIGFTAAPPPVPTAPASQTKAAVIQSFERVRHEFEERLAHFEMPRAEQWLHKIEELHSKHPEYVSEAAVQRCRMDQTRVELKRKQLLEEIEALAAGALAAANDGRTEEAAQILKRLSAMHAARPHVLPETRLEEIRAGILAGSEQYEYREATRALLEREKAVAADVKHLADGIHQFHLVARQIPHNDPRYSAAEAEYRATLKKLRWHDKDWLGDLMIELYEALERIHDPTGKSEEQVNRFVASVRSAITHAVQEARQIAEETRPG